MPMALCFSRFENKNGSRTHARTHSSTGIYFRDVRGWLILCQDLVITGIQMCYTREKFHAKTDAAEIIPVIPTDQFNKGHNLLFCVLRQKAPKKQTVLLNHSSSREFSKRINGFIKKFYNVCEMTLKFT